MAGINTVYMSERLAGKLGAVTHYPLTIVSAPMGYGKTTTIKKYFSGHAANPRQVIWKAMLGNGPDGFWKDFVTAFACVNPAFSEAAALLPLPLTGEGRRQFLRLFLELCENQKEETILILDDMQMADCDEIRAFLYFFSRSLPQSFHMVLLCRSQSYSRDSVFRIYGLAQYLFLEDFVFSPKDISAYAKAYGIGISHADAVRLYSISSGWPALVKMNLMEYEQSGVFFAESEIFQILKDVLYDPLSESAKSLLSALSVCGAFTAKQAEYICGSTDIHGLLKELSDDGLHLRRDRHSGEYKISPILSAWFQSQKSGDDSACLNRLAEWYLKIDENALARQIFHKTKNFDALMEAVEKRRFNVHYGRDELEFISYYTDCPAEIRRRHPWAILTFARQLFALGHDKMGEQVCREFEETMKLRADLDGERRKELEGTYEVLLAYSQYNDLSKMLEHLRKAQAKFSPQDARIIWPDAGVNDSFSLLYMYHRRPGDLQKETALFSEYGPAYSKLIGGWLDGAEYVFQAESQYITGDFQAAEISLHKAMLTVHRDNQWNIWVCAAVLQMRIHFMKGNWHAIEYLLDEVRESGSAQDSGRIAPAVSMLEIFLYSKLEQPARVSDLFDKMPKERFRLVPRATAMLYCFHSEALLAKGETMRLLALSDEYLASAKAYPNIYAEILLRITFSGAYQQLNQPLKAKECLQSALELALPDNIIVPFVEMFRYIIEVLPLVDMDACREEIDEISRLGREYIKTSKKMLSAQFSADNFGLTNREMEIAGLAAMRLSNKEIADKLFISESTVKTQLARAFSKLDIKKRRDLQLYFPEK
jgi:LuxR family maltose regulon positive regulatory protein